MTTLESSDNLRLVAAHVKSLEVPACNRRRCPIRRHAQLAIEAGTSSDALTPPWPDWATRQRFRCATDGQPPACSTRCALDRGR